MKITKEEDYGILLIYALLYPGGKRYLSLSEISQKYNLSEFFLKRVANKLKRAGLIKSKEGIKGGYILAKAPSSISYGEILQAISGPIDISPSCQECGKRICQPRSVWKNINNEITKLLNKTSLVY